MEAAHITWRPLGRVLVEQGLLTGEELEFALARQQVTGERLGETIVKCGFVSGPELAAALAAQYGIELATEKGFGTGLRSEIQRRHESDRKRIVQLVPDADGETESEPEPETVAEIFEFVPTPERQDSGEAALLAQLEEQWAKLAAAEAALAERERELAEQADVRDRARSELAERERELTESRDHARAELAERERELAEWAGRERELTERAESRERELAELAELRDRDVAEAAESRDRELAELAESRDHVRAELAERERELAELAARRERELAEWAERERELSQLTESHDSDLRRLEEVNERLREQLDELRNAPIAPEQGERTPVTPASHLVFVQLDERYALISRDGPPPSPRTPLFLPDVDEGSFVVAGLRHSPLPGDERPCVYVHRG